MLLCMEHIYLKIEIGADSEAVVPCGKNSCATDDSSYETGDHVRWSTMIACILAWYLMMMMKR